jgi:hypothetical protein
MIRKTIIIMGLGGAEGMMRVSHMPALTALSASRWQVLCWRRSSDTTCRETSINDHPREVRAEMPCLGTIIRMEASLLRALLVYQRQEFHFAITTINW